MVTEEEPLAVVPLALAVLRASVGGVVALCAVACPSWLLFAPVVAAVVFRVPAVPPLFVVVESEPEAPAPLDVAEAEPPMPVALAVAELCGCALEEVVLEPAVLAVLVAPLDCVAVDDDRPWMTWQFASIRMPRKL